MFMKNQRVIVHNPVGKNTGIMHRISGVLGFTLIELLISITIFLFLGILLISLFRSGMDLWHSGEAGKTVFSRARNVLAVFRDDFTAMYRHPIPREDAEAVDIRLAADLVADESSEYKSQRIRFVRTISDEMKDYPLKDAGTYTITDPSGTVTPADESDDMKLYDQFNDRNELSSGTLAAAGGLMEVGYLLKAGRLYRAVKAPVGYKADHMGTVKKISLFNGSEFFSMQMSVLAANARVLANNVLHYEVRFWAPDTESWDVSDPREDKEATYRWDSTRVDSNSYPFAFDEAGAPVGDPANDIFPAKVKVFLVVDSNRRTRTVSRFVRKEGGSPEKIVCTSAQGFEKDESTEAAAYERRFFKIGNEWISYSSIDGDSFVVNERGTRFTEERIHYAGDEVYQGRLFTLIIDIPGAAHE